MDTEEPKAVNETIEVLPEILAIDLREILDPKVKESRVLNLPSSLAAHLIETELPSRKQSITDNFVAKLTLLATDKPDPHRAKHLKLNEDPRLT
jgi:hypothetical protein